MPYGSYRKGKVDFVTGGAFTDVLHGRMYHRPKRDKAAELPPITEENAAEVLAAMRRNGIDTSRLVWRERSLDDELRLFDQQSSRSRRETRGRTR